MKHVSLISDFLCAFLHGGLEVGLQLLPILEKPLNMETSNKPPRSGRLHERQIQLLSFFIFFFLLFKAFVKLYVIIAPQCAVQKPTRNFKMSVGSPNWKAELQNLSTHTVPSGTCTCLKDTTWRFLFNS